MNIDDIMNEDIEDVVRVAVMERVHLPKDETEPEPAPKKAAKPAETVKPAAKPEETEKRVAEAAAEAQRKKAAIEAAEAAKRRAEEQAELERKQAAEAAKRRAEEQAELAKKQAAEHAEMLKKQAAERAEMLKKQAAATTDDDDLDDEADDVDTTGFDDDDDDDDEATPEELAAAHIGAYKTAKTVTAKPVSLDRDDETYDDAADDDDDDEAYGYTDDDDDDEAYVGTYDEGDDESNGDELDEEGNENKPELIDVPPKKYGLRGFVGDMIFLAAALLVIVLLFYIFPPYIVDGPSMQKTLDHHAFGFGCRFSTPEHGDIVIVNTGDRAEGTDGAYFIKRVIGVPGDTIRCVYEQYDYDVTLSDGSVVVAGGNVYRVYRNGELLDEPYVWFGGNNIAREVDEITLGADEYFIMGDNRFNSNDSRAFGPIKKSDIKCTMVFFIYGKHNP